MSESKQWFADILKQYKNDPDFKKESIIFDLSEKLTINEYQLARMRRQLYLYKKDLTEVREENEELKTHAYAVAKDLRKRMNEQDALWQETAQHLLERAEKAEQTIKELQEKLSEK